jgi:hypothetical protein
MATIIDSLMIELGLDTSKFDKNQKKSVEALRKLDEQQKKYAKQTQDDAKKTAEGFNKATQAVMEYFLAYVGVSQIKNFVENTTKANVEIGRSAHLLSMSAIELKSWGDVAQITGGSIDTITGTLQNLQQSLAAIKAGNAEVLKPIAMLGAIDAFDINNNTVNLGKLADAIERYKKAGHTEAEAQYWASALGIDQKTFLLLEQGRAAIDENYDHFLKLNKGIQEAADGSAEITKQWVETEKQAQALGRVIMDDLNTPISFLNKGIQYALKGFRALFSLSLDPLRESAQEVVNAEEAAAKGKANAGVSAIGGVPRNLRNNNPGNIEYGEFAKKHGATGSDGRFAIFPSMEAGKAAQMSLLEGKYNKGLDTIAKLYQGSGNVKGWLGSGADLKDANSAIANVMKLTGIGANQHINPNQLEMIRQAMQSNEGMIGSGVSAQSGTRHINNTSEVNIQNMNITTNATDSAGIAKDLPRHIQNNALMGSGMLGTN